MTTVPALVTKLHTRLLTPRVLMLLFTLEVSAVTNLMTSLVGGADQAKTRMVLTSSFFYLVAAAYALTAEGVLNEIDDLTPDLDNYRKEICDRWADLAWWLGAHIAGVVCGTIVLWPRSG